MANSAKKDTALSINSTKITTANPPDKVETFGGKDTARVTKFYNQPDDSIVKITRKINKDSSISDKIEHRHK